MNYSNNAACQVLITLSLFVVMSGNLNAQVSDDSLVRVTAVRDVYPYWSPDGKQIVFQSDRNSSMEGKDQIYSMNADGSEIKRLTFHDASDETPVWSPDGSKILFSSYITSENNELFIMNIDGEINYLPARNEVMHAYSDHSKVKKTFNITDNISLTDGITKMVDWVKIHGARETPKFKDIEIFEKLPQIWLEK